MKGLWYSKHWQFMTESSPPYHCTCDGYIWSCSNADDVLIAPMSVDFAPGNVEPVDPRDQSRFDEWARSMVQDPTGKLALVGIINPDEGDKGPEMARRRAEAVRDALIRRGVPESRLSAEVQPDSRKRPYPVSSVMLRAILDPPE